MTADGFEAIYDYVDEQGNLLFQVCRKKHNHNQNCKANCEITKEFPQRIPFNGGWNWEVKGVRRVLYQFPDVLDAVKNKRILYIVEGEKDADNLRAIGLDATTSPGGALKWKAKDKGNYPQYLKGAHVIIVPDNDAPGRTHATQIFKSLKNVAASVKILLLPGLPEKGDVSDFIAGKPPEQAKKELLEFSAYAHEDTESLEAAKSKRGKRKTIAETLLELCCVGLELFHDDDKAFVTVGIGGHKETYSLRSRTFKRLVSNRFYSETKKVVNAQSLSDALTVLEGRALFEGTQQKVNVRTAQHEDKIYIDLCNDEWQAIEIDGTGWRIVNDFPVKFIRSRGMLPLPVPVAPGDIGLIRKFHNLKDKKGKPLQDAILLEAFLIQSANPVGPYPSLVLHGEQGVGKSTISRLCKAVIDPCTASLRGEPREQRDVMIAASRSHLLCWDNLSRIPGWLSDCLSRIPRKGDLVHGNCSVMMRKSLSMYNAR